MNPADDPKVREALRPFETCVAEDGCNSIRGRDADDILASLDALGVELAPKGLTDAVRAQKRTVTAPGWASAICAAQAIVRRWDEEHP